VKFHYCPETDSPYIDLADRPSAESVEVSPGVVLYHDADGAVVGLDTDQASKRLSLSRLDIDSLPVRTVAVT